MNTTRVDKAKFSDRAYVTKRQANSVLVEGVQVPIVHTYGKHSLNYPKLKVALGSKLAALNSKLFGVSNPMEERYFGSEMVIVEKFKEVNVPGIGNDAVDILAKKGYGFRQICQKIGKPVLTEINIGHIVRGMRDYKLNLMLNEGIDITWELLKEGNAIDYFTNALARVGVGNSSTAPVATQTGLIGGSTAFVGMEATFPLTSAAQRIDFKGSFGSGVAEFPWEEFTVDNGVTPNDNLQRLVSAKGTKSAGETWTAEIQVTGS